MNDLVFVMCNLKLVSKQMNRTTIFYYDDIHLNDEWISKKRKDSYDEDCKEALQPLQVDNIINPCSGTGDDHLVDLNDVVLSDGSNDTTSESDDMNMKDVDSDDDSAAPNIDDNDGDSGGDNDDDFGEDDYDVSFEDLC